MELSSEQLGEIDAALFSGNVIGAVRSYRRFTETQLLEAKSFIDERLELLRNQAPSRFAVHSTPPEPDPALLQQIEHLPDSALGALRSTCEQIEKLLYGYNYQVTLAVNAVAFSGAKLAVAATMVKLYPESTPHDAHVIQVCFNEVVAGVTQCLTYEGDSSSGPQLNNKGRTELCERLLPAYFQQLNAIVPLQSSVMYSYDSDTGLPGYNVFWFFAYLIHSVDSRRCVVITGMSSD